MVLFVAACFASPKPPETTRGQILTNTFGSATATPGIKVLNKQPSSPLIIENHTAVREIFTIATASPTVPLAVIQDSAHEFSPVVEGTQIVHDFIVQNKGKAPLIIEKVKTD